LDRAIDEHVGRQLVRRRCDLGLTQEQVAVALDINVERLRQYEHGESAVWAARLWALAAALDVPVDYFFDGLITTRGGCSA
jgi:transcriptional regulator with XRE-family HTH domain